MIDWNRWHQFQQAMPWWQWCLVIVAVTVAIWLIVRLRSFFRENADDADQTLEMLTQFRELHHEGGLSDDEFRLIRSRLASSARAAHAKDGKKPKAIPVVRETTMSTDLQNGASGVLPVTHATEENEANSERMTEKQTE